MKLLKSQPNYLKGFAILVSISDLIRDNYLFTKDGGISQNIEEAAEYLKKLDDFNYKFQDRKISSQ